jgi:hypothetical protein
MWNMDEMKWSSSDFLAMLAASSNLYWFLLNTLADICQTYGQQQCQEGMACPKSAITHSLHIMVISSLIGPIWMK